MKKNSFNFRRYVIYAIFILLFFLLMGLSARVNELNQLTEQYEMMKTEVNALRATNNNLATSIAYATSVAAVDEYARERGYMVKPGEILVVPISPNIETPSSAKTPEVISDDFPNWKIWYQLFFSDTK
jgi:cell division protein FtsB